MVQRHASQTAALKRLKRAHGHLAAVIGMIEGGRPCLDLAQQLSAVEKALTAAKRTLIQDHIDDCLDRAVEDGKAAEALAEFRAIVRFL